MKSKREIAEEERTIIKETTVFSGVKYLAEAIYVVRGLIIAGFLGPAMYGVWTFIKTILTAGSYTGMGTTEGMVRQYPFYKARKQLQKAESIQQNSISWRVTVSTIVGLIIIALSFLPKAGEYSTEYRIAGVLFLVNSIHFFVAALFKSRQEAIKLSRYELAYAVLNTAFGLSLLFFFEVAGLLVGMILAQLILLGYLIAKKDLSLKITFNKTILRELFIVGLPMMILGATFFLMHNIDKIVIYAMLGNTLTGYYGLASFLSLIVNYIPAAFTIVLFPRMVAKYSRTKSKASLKDYYTKPLRMIATSMPIIIGLLFINIDLPIIYLLPEYVPSIPVLRILMISIFFSTLISIPVNIAITLKKHQKLMKMMIITLFMGAVLDYAAIKGGYGINGVAWITALLFFAASILANHYSAKSLPFTMKERKSLATNSYAPFAYSIIITIIVMRLFTVEGSVLYTDLLRTGIFIVAMIPLVAEFNRHLSIRKTIRGLLGRESEGFCMISPKAYPYFKPSIKKTYGGAEVQRGLLAKTLAKNGEQVSIIVGDYGQEKTEKISGVNLIKALNMKKKVCIGNARKITRAIRNNDSDIIIQRTLTSASAIVAIYCQLLGKKFVYMVAHDAETDGTHPLYKKMFGKTLAKITFTRASLVIAQNNYEKRHLKKRYPEANVTILKKGVETARPKAKKEYDGIWVGRCDEWKNPEVFIKLAKKNPEKKFIMICPPATGKIEYFEKIAHAAKKMKNIEFYIRMENERVRETLRNCSVYCFTSDKEGDWPMVVLEAAATGLPIITHGVNYEKLIDDYKGGAYSKGDFKAFNNSFRKLLNDKKRYQQASKGAKAYIKELHDMETQANKFKKLIDDVT